MRSIVTAARLGLASAVLLALVGCERGDGGAAVTPPGAPPAVDTTEMEPQVAALLDAARDAVVASPESADAWWQLAATCDAHGIEQVAAEAYRRATELDPDAFKYRYNRAVAMEAVSAAESLRLLEEAATLNEHYAPLQMRFGDALVKQGRSKEAAAAYGRAVALDASLDRARRSLGQVLLSLGDTQQAIEQLEFVATRHPDDGPTAAALAQAYGQAGDADAAADAASRGAGQDVIGFVDPIRQDVLALGISSFHCRRRATRLMEAGDHASAVPDLEIIARLTPDDPRAHYRLGYATLRSGRAEEAIAHFERAIDLDESLVDAYIELAGAWTSVRAYAEASVVYGRALERDPERTELRWSLAATLAQSGQIDAALSQFELAASQSPDDARGELNWGTTLMQAGQVELARDHFAEAVRLAPDYATAWCNLGIATERLGRDAEAANCYRRAVELDPRSPAARRLAELGR